MEKDVIRSLLESVRAGEISPDEALSRLRHFPSEKLGFATLDHHRSLRCGFPEVIFCPSKTRDQMLAIFSRLAKAGASVLATRATAEQAAAVLKKYPRAKYDATARTIVLKREKAPAPVGHVAVVAAGTSDLPVAEEARITAQTLGANVTTHYDVGVAGIHRLLAHAQELQQARAIVAVAGMEGALASVVGGLVAAPVIAVPTSVGYGASFGGLAALLTMLNSCAAGVSVVNIDNGFAGGYIAAMINRQGEPTRKENHREHRENSGHGGKKKPGKKIR
jgi:pyridinium-3,5-biscarboxylic acid mononucleotide synthase